MFKDIKLFGTGTYTGKDGSSLIEPSKPVSNETGAEEE